MSTISFRIDGDTIKCTHTFYGEELSMGGISYRNDSRSLVSLDSPFDLTTEEIRVLCDIIDEELGCSKR